MHPIFERMTRDESIVLCVGEKLAACGGSELNCSTKLESFGKDHSSRGHRRENVTFIELLLLLTHTPWTPLVVQ